MLIRTKKGTIKEIIYDANKLYNYGLNRLGTREYGRKELLTRMQRLQPDLEIVNSVLDKLEKIGYLSEERRITSMLNQYKNSESTNKTKQRMLQKGLDKELINEALSQKQDNPEENNELDTASNLLERKFKTYDPEKWKKMVAFLVQKGYPYDKIKQAIEIFKEK